MKFKVTHIRPSRGLGDTVAKITRATGIERAVKWLSEITGMDCGCEKRREWLNKFSVGK